MYMKNTQTGFVGIVLILIFALALGIGGTYYVMDKKEDVPVNATSTVTKIDTKPDTIEVTTSTSLKPKTDPSVLVKAYYEEILNALNSGVSTEKIRLDPLFVTQKINNNFKKLIKENPDGIPYDPFLCAQDFPGNAKSLIIQSVSKSEDRAEVEVYLFGHVAGNKPPLVSLIYDNGWKIDGITCPRGGDL